MGEMPALKSKRSSCLQGEDSCTLKLISHRQIVPHWLNFIHTWWAAISHLNALHQMAGSGTLFFFFPPRLLRLPIHSPVRRQGLAIKEIELQTHLAPGKTKKKRKVEQCPAVFTERRAAYVVNTRWLLGCREAGSRWCDCVRLCRFVSGSEKKRAHRKEGEIRRNDGELALLTPPTIYSQHHLQH